MTNPHSYHAEASSSSSRRHSKYYFEDQMVTLLVEETLFKVHRYYLVKGSPMFRTMFECPIPEGSVADGSSDDHPLFLPCVLVKEFEVLLDYFYEGLSPREGTKKSKHKGQKAVDTWKNSETELDQLVDLLSIASRFDFDTAREFAIASIDSCKTRLDPATQICLAEKHNIQHWLKPAYEAICRRLSPLSLADAEKLGLEKTVKIAEARERIRNMENPFGQFPSLHEGTNVLRVVNQMFFPGSNSPPAQQLGFIF